MACQVSITSVIPTGQPGQPVTSVVVEGTATECSSVTVRVGCGGGTQPTQSVPVDAQSEWQATFNDLTGTDCVCDDPNVALRVRAFCKADPDCADNQTLIPIPCQTNPCPTIDQINVTVPNCEQVLVAGGWDVNFSAAITGIGVTNYVWSFGDGVTLSGANLQQVANHYPCAGDYLVTLVILSECEPGYADVYTMTLELTPCGCPTISSIDSKQDANNPCHWVFRAKVGDPFFACIEEYIWNFGDGIQESGTTKAEHTYDKDDTFNVTLTLLGRIGQLDGSPCYATETITVSGCGRGDGNGDGQPCPWWNPACWNWCIIFGVLLATWISAYIVGIAAGAAEAIIALLPDLILLILGGTLTPGVLAGIVGGLLGAAIIAYSSFCGFCYLRNVLISAVVLAIAIMITLLIAGFPLPFLVAALWVAAGFLAAAAAAHVACKDEA